MEPVAATPERLRADARRNRERIVAAATEAFAEHGLDIGTAEVARRAGVGEATLFRRFPTKHDLLVAVVEARVRSLADTARACREDPDPEAGLRRFVEEAVELHVRDRALTEHGGIQLSCEPALHPLRDEVVAAVAGLVGAARDAGALRPDIEGVDILVLVKAIATAGADLESECPGLWRRYVAVVLAGLRPGADAAPLPVAPPTVEEADRAMMRRGGRC